MPHRRRPRPGLPPDRGVWLSGETINLELGDAKVRLLRTEDSRPYLPACVLFERVRDAVAPEGSVANPQPGFAFAITGVST